MNEQVKQNMDLVGNLMNEAAAKNGQALQQGNNALLPVIIDYEADSGRHFQGTVFFRRPSAMDYMKMGGIKARLLQENGVRPIIEMVATPPTPENPEGGFLPYESMVHVDNSVVYLARAIAACDVLITQPVPAWFQDHRNSTDTDLIIEVYRMFDAALLSFRNGAQGVPAADSGERARAENVGDTQVVRERELAGERRDTTPDGPSA